MATISLWRIAKHTATFRADDLSGGGAAATGGRWNSKGNHVVYASFSIALATLETLAHLGGGDINCRNRFLVEILVPESVWNKRDWRDTTMLPPTWIAEPPGMDSINIGDAWLTSGVSALLVVPSVIVHEEANILINPTHPDAKSITARVARQYVYDPRLG